MAKKINFEWDENKDKANQKKHGVSFAFVQLAFLDSSRIILEDLEHSANEKRFYCLGQVSEGDLNCKIHISFQ